MKFPSPVHDAVLLRRYKRFLADIRLADGTVTTAHCPNPGSMLGVCRPGSPLLVTRSPDPKRKLAWTTEAIRIGRRWVGIHPRRANAVVEEALARRVLPALAPYGRVRREVRWSPGSRADFLLEADGLPPCWVEVKSVTLARGPLGLFPDSVSARATRHLGELAERVRLGERAVLLFAVPRGDVTRVGPADGIDPVYGEALRRAGESGVELLAHRIEVTRRGLVLRESLPVLPGPHPWSSEALSP